MKGRRRRPRGNPRRWRRFCPSKKVAYTLESEARAALGAIDPGDPRRRECRAYRCQDCGAWHLTSRAYQR